jgi:hypothetical protein
MTWVVAARNRRSVSPSSKEARTGGLEMRALRSSSPFCASSIRRKELDFFSNLYKGSPRSPRWDTQRLRVARHPMSCWTSLTFLIWPNFVMAEILLGFASMQHLVMTYPRRLLQGTPKVDFSRFSLMLKRLRLVKVSSRLRMWLSPSQVFKMMSST